MSKLFLASNFQDEVENVIPLWDIFKNSVEKWIVVDSGSVDGTQDKLREVVGDKLILIESDIIKVNGYGAARTSLIELCEGADFVLIIDGDERMFPEDIEKLNNLMQQDPPPDYDMIRLPRCHYQNLEATIVEYGSMERTGPDWKEAIRINQDWQPRLIRRIIINGKSKVQFFRRVHELTKGIDKELRSLANPVIRHFGWCKTFERKEMVVNLCNALWEMDKDNKEISETYLEENKSGSAQAWWPAYKEKYKVK